MGSSYRKASLLGGSLVHWSTHFYSTWFCPRFQILIVSVGMGWNLLIQWGIGIKIYCSIPIQCYFSVVIFIQWYHTHLHGILVSYPSSKLPKALPGCYPHYNTPVFQILVGSIHIGWYLSDWPRTGLGWSYKFVLVRICFFSFSMILDSTSQCITQFSNTSSIHCLNQYQTEIYILVTIQKFKW